MSFIDKALERAKAMHQKKKEKPEAPARREMPTPGLPPLRPLEAKPPALPAEEITYTVTRRVRVDPETLRRHRIILQEQGTIAEEYKLLRTHILQRTRGEGRNTLMVTGPRPGEGKTLTTINLALCIAREVNQTVLLVDADLRQPSVHRYFGIPAGPGLADYLVDGVPISEMLVHPEGLGKLVLLPAGKRVSHAAELINSPLMADLVQELKHFYSDRYVLFDLPPLMSYADALAFAPLVDGIILVVEAGRTPREEIERALERLKEFPILGFVLNKVDTSPSSHYYYYGGNEKPAQDGKLRFPWFKK